MAELTTGEYGRRVDASDQTVRNWCKAGVIPARRDDRGQWRIDGDAADKALANNRRAHGRGGKRRGAGRKRDEKRRDGLGYGDAEVVAAIGRREEPPPRAMHISQMLAFTEEEARSIIAIGSRVALGPAHLDQLKTLEAIRKLKRENDAANGLLVEADQVRATWSETLRMLKMQLESVPARLAARITTGLEHSRVVETIDLLKASGVDADIIEAVRRVITAPGDDVRAIAEDETRVVMLAMAGGEEREQERGSAGEQESGRKPPSNSEDRRLAPAAH